MRVLRPAGLDQALAMLAEEPSAVPIAGGTDLMVAVNFGRLRPATLVDLGRCAELGEVRRGGGLCFVGAGVTYATVLRELADQAALAQAARTVGSPQIRNRGTLGGNLGTASPAGDALPPLAAYDAEVVLVSARGGERRLPWDVFLAGPRLSLRAPDELILGAAWRSPQGPGSFSKVGTRNAMVIAIAGLCLQLDLPGRQVRVALGSVGPMVTRAGEAEAFAAAALEELGAWEDPGVHLPSTALDRFGELVAAAARPIDDLRGTAVYRRHACRTLGRRALAWTLAERTPVVG